jgi:hypothetical protein
VIKLEKGIHFFAPCLCIRDRFSGDQSRIEYLADFKILSESATIRFVSNCYWKSLVFQYAFAGGLGAHWQSAPKRSQSRRL